MGRGAAAHTALPCAYCVPFAAPTAAVAPTYCAAAGVILDAFGQVEEEVKKRE